jgi:hypothetical protein
MNSDEARDILRKHGEVKAGADIDCATYSLLEELIHFLSFDAAKDELDYELLTLLLGALTDRSDLYLAEGFLQSMKNSDPHRRALAIVDAITASSPDRTYWLARAAAAYPSELSAPALADLLARNTISDLAAPALVEAARAHLEKWNHAGLAAALRIHQDSEAHKTHTTAAEQFARALAAARRSEELKKADHAFEEGKLAEAATIYRTHSRCLTPLQAQRMAIAERKQPTPQNRPPSEDDKNPQRKPRE